MEDKQEIFTIDGRDNVFLSVAQDVFNLSSNLMHSEITHLFTLIEKQLLSKGIDYKKLKSALIPNHDKKEIVFVFDTTQIESHGYGIEVFNRIIPTLNKESNQSVFSGDYLGNNQKVLMELFGKNINTVKNYYYKGSNQFYLVYINNITKAMLEKQTKLLNKYEPYIGYFDLTFSSRLKAYLSCILIKKFIKHRNIIITPSEEETDLEEQIEDVDDIYGYEFKKNGFVVKTVNRLLYELFLSYKIEREVLEVRDDDARFSLCVVSPEIFPIDDFSVVISEEKLKYLNNGSKGKIMKKALLHTLKKEELEFKIKQKIKNNYIYNMEFLKQHNVVKFNIMLEFYSSDIDTTMKMPISLEYKPNDRILRVITMY